MCYINCVFFSGVPWVVFPFSFFLKAFLCTEQIKDTSLQVKGKNLIRRLFVHV